MFVRIVDFAATGEGSYYFTSRSTTIGLVALHTCTTVIQMRSGQYPNYCSTDFFAEVLKTVENYLPINTIRICTSLGLIPDMRLAWPSVLGFILLNFSLASFPREEIFL